jgi:two-component system, cell cycle response regulator
VGESEPPSEDTETRPLSIDPRDALPVSGRTHPCVVLMTGPDLGAVHRLDPHETILGRSQELAIRLSDEGVSRRHARLVLDVGRAFLEDLGSVNGTFLNGEPITVALIKDGDRIQLGPATIFRFTYADATEETFQRQLHEAAMRDRLTGTFNRASLDQRIDSELAFARRHKSQLGLVMFDVDHFKSINDTHGHLAGDEVLRHLARRIQATLRTEDMLARFGGEEFCVVCRGIRPPNVLQLADRVRAVVQEQSFDYAGTSIPVTISAGVATYPDVDFATTNALVGAADAALLEAKRQGRNRCVMATPRREAEKDPPTKRFAVLPPQSEH